MHAHPARLHSLRSSWQAWRGRLRSHSPAHALPALLDDDGESVLQADAIIVLGGGLVKLDNGEWSVPPWSRARLEAAAAIHHSRRKAGVHLSLLVSGGSSPHKPIPLDDSLEAVSESAVGCDLLLSLGVPASCLLKETVAADTIGNAWFSLTTHAKPALWRRPLVITSAFHMPRSRAAFDWVAGLDWGDNAPLLPLQYLSTPNEGLEAHVLAARADREAASLKALAQNAQSIRTASAFHAWLNATHLCYAVSRQHEEPEAPHCHALQSY